MKQLVGIRVNVLDQIDPKTKARELSAEIVLILGRTKYVQKSDKAWQEGAVDDMQPVLNLKAVRFTTNIKGLESLRDFFDSMVSELQNLAEK